MVSANPKRKKTADMPESPPKRVTRARAARIPDDEPRKPKTTQIATPSAKAAAEKKKATLSVKAAAPSKPVKRKTRADEVVGAVEEPATKEPEVEVQQPVQPTKAKGRPKKVTPPKDEEVPISNAAKTRTRQPKPPVTDNVEPEIPKTRGRPKRAAEPAAVVPEVPSQPETTAQEPAKKATRGRPASTTARVAAKPAPPKAKAIQVKKRVKFDEEPDKENMPVETAQPKKSAMKPTGLKAKPVRMPASVRASATRARKRTQGTVNDTKEAETKENLPLSPKKVMQVAKSDPISEDELAGEKTPVRALSKSPSKRPMSPTKDPGSVSKLDFSRHTAPTSPAKAMPSSAFASPARRPPPSPFKDSLKSSPLKLDLGKGTAQPLLSASRTPMKSSLLQESPKRVMLTDNVAKPVLLAMRSPMKASLLQSPARRPPSSPTKATAVISLENAKPAAAAIDLTASPRKPTSLRAWGVSDDHAISSPLRASQSPEHNFKVHTITDEEQKTIEVDEEELAGQLASPKEQAEDAETADVLEEVDATGNASPASEDSMSVDEPEYVGIVDEVTKSPAPPAESREFAAPLFSIGSSSLRRISIESDTSEDELASPQKIGESSPLRRHDISAKDFGTPATINGQNALQTSNAQFSFTPLAYQLSSWNASSPEKQTRKPRQARGVFSLGGAAVLPVPGQSPAEMDTTHQAKSSFFEDEMAMHNDQNDTSYYEMNVDYPSEVNDLQISQDSIASDEYGDENAMPAEADLLRAEQDADRTLTCTPARVFTPIKTYQRPLEMHTVSKVPLRPSAEDSPIVPARQRSRSVGGPLAVVSDIEAPEDSRARNEPPTTPALAPTRALQTPSSGMRLDAETPGRTVRKGVVPDVLKGAVVYVDVHTTEGADASGIFVDLLTQMGARCLKQWHWNPRASTASSLDSNASPQETSPDVSASKIGITHVVYKDGGKRTLEKVRSSNGVVLCVGVGWVLE